MGTSGGSRRGVQKAVGRKHSAKQKAFGTVLAGAVFFSLRPRKAPMTSGGLFGALGKSGRRGGGRGIITPSKNGIAIKHGERHRGPRLPATKGESSRALCGMGNQNPRA